MAASNLATALGLAGGRRGHHRVLRHNEAPQVETHILPSPNPPSGVGEPGTPVIAPAVANALLAMGQPPTTSLPFVKA